MAILPFGFLSFFQNRLIFSLFFSFLKDRQKRQRTIINRFRVTSAKNTLDFKFELKFTPSKHLKRLLHCDIMVSGQICSLRNKTVTACPFGLAKAAHFAGKSKEAVTNCNLYFTL